MAINVNKPTRLIMNHLDYLSSKQDEKIKDDFIREVEHSIRRRIDYIGCGANHLKIRNEKWLIMNKDKNTHNDRNVMPGMLSSSHIDYYAQKYGIIKHYKDTCLGSASYHMRVGENVLTWKEGTRVEFCLGETEDNIKNIRTNVTLEPNSLTFLTTVEEFRLPKDIIARFNLKSKWVHQGLLLGTGPIVDPQLHARLLIPVHNFSNQPVTMDYGEEFISVEFTKTLDPGDTLALDDGSVTQYIENPNWDYDFHKYRQRIANKRVESSISSSIEKYDKTIAEQKDKIDSIASKSQKTIIQFSWGAAFTIFSAIVGLVLFYYTTWQVVDSAKGQVFEALKTINEYKDKNIDLNHSTNKTNYELLQKQLDELKSDISFFGKSQEEVKVMDMRIKELEKKIKR